MNFIFLNFVAFPNRKDALLSTKNNTELVIRSSGSSGLFHGNSICQQTSPNLTISKNWKMEWCSNMGTNDNEIPWISFSYPNKSMKLRGFSMRNGCCNYYDSCCNALTNEKYGDYCCTKNNNYYLQGSVDNSTWKTIYHVKGANQSKVCSLETYEFDLTEKFNIVRLIIGNKASESPKCMHLNQIELYGEFVNTEKDADQDSVSIIGKMKNKHH